MSSFEETRKQVQQYLEVHGLPGTAYQNRPRRKNFYSAVAQLILEADPDPEKRWSATIALWLVTGLVTSHEEHIEEICKFMRLRREAKRVPRGAPDYARAQAIRRINIEDFSAPAGLTDALRKYDDASSSSRGPCMLEQVYYTDGGLTVYSAADVSCIKDPMVKTAKWCVLGNYFGHYGGPPYYPVARGNSWVGIIVPKHATIGPDQAFRNAGNTGIMDAATMADLAPFIQETIGFEAIKELIGSRLTSGNCSYMPSICAMASGMTITDDEYLRAIIELSSTGNIKSEITDDVLFKLMERVALPSGLIVRNVNKIAAFAKNIRLHVRNAAIIASCNKKGMPAEAKSLASIALLQGGAGNTGLLRNIVPDHYGMVLEIGNAWLESFFASRGKRLVFGSYNEAISLELTDDELLSGRFYYGIYREGCIALHIADKNGKQVWLRGGPLAIKHKFDERIAYCIQHDCIKPVKSINKSAPQINDELLRIHMLNAA